MKINDAVRIRILPGSDSVSQSLPANKGPEDNQFVQHQGRIKDVKGNTVTVALALVLRDDEFLTIHPGVAVAFQKSSEEGLFTCEAVVNRLQAEPSPVVVVTRVSDFTRLQRREFFRVKLSLETRYAQLGDEGNAEEREGDRWLPAALRDLSAGGACVTINGQRQVGEELVLELPLDRGTLCMKGVVCRCKATGRGKKILYEVGIKFLEPTGADQSQIMGFVFAQQRKQVRGRLK
ncbi:MAG TPA: PilZ domain-containing protein [Anaerolineae bacterium]